MTLQVDRASQGADMTDLKSRVFKYILLDHLFSLKINQCKKKTNKNIKAEELGLKVIDTSNWELVVKDRTEKQEERFILKSKTNKKKKRESMKKSKN